MRTKLDKFCNSANSRRIFGESKHITMTRYREWFAAVNRAIVAEMAIQKKTQKDLAEALGIHAATMNRKLKDPGLFSVGELGEVCEALCIDLKDPKTYGSSAD
jgi:DNA-binding Xre family transcriptional regulator